MAAHMVATQADAQTIVYEDIDDVTIEIGDIVLVDVNAMVMMTSCSRLLLHRWCMVIWSCVR